MEKSNAIFHPIIGSIQKIALYETKSRFYLVGSNNTQTRFRVLKIDRMEPIDLVITDDKVEYNKDEIQNLLNTIDAGNRNRSSLSKIISAFGIVGFVKFLEGYYIVLITKRRKAAVIGHHTIYKIEDTVMLYIPNDTIRVLHPDEPRYLKMFQNIDLWSNFYFSYSYDITHTLQYNLSIPKEIIPTSSDDDCKISVDDILNTPILLRKNKHDNTTAEYAIRTKPNRKFIWNNHLLNPVEKELHPDWILYIVHGFVAQSNINIFGRCVFVTLIARRSSKYAGTRFLKRGANFQGDVANEVETEQMVFDSCISSLSQGHFTSFVQMRGSIPGHWSQDMSKMVAKPPTITIDLSDPFSETASAHFNELLKRYGAPIVILNLVKKHEKKPQEKLLSQELNFAVKYLNQFLPPDHQIIYKTFDMARKTKGKVDVMGRLADIAKSAVMKTGIFHNKPKYYAQKGTTLVGQMKEQNTWSIQTGIIRTNCVDCLDRTNTAQFAIGRCVLGYQLCALGILDTPKLAFDTDAVRMLESLYEDHGDTLALQYGGSQLVHRIKTYRKTAPWTSQGNDFMQTLSRYYRNTFSDAEKQNTINLFLGLFIPTEGKPHIWDYTTDYHFHHKVLPIRLDKPLTQWWQGAVLKCLPYSYNDLTKTCSELIQVHDKDVEMIDSYSDYYRPHELSVLSDIFTYKMSNSIRDVMPNFTTDYSPFTIRYQPGKRHDQHLQKGEVMKNPSLTGQSSMSSTTSSGSSEDSSDSTNDESSIYTNESQMSLSKESGYKFTFDSIFPPMSQVYGCRMNELKKPDLLTYKKYILMGKKANGTIKNTALSSIQFVQKSNFNNDTTLQVKPPTVALKSIKIYEDYINTVATGGSMPKSSDLQIYQKYASFK